MQTCKVLNYECVQFVPPHNGQCCCSTHGTTPSGWTPYGHCVIFLNLYPSRAICTLITQKCTVRFAVVRLSSAVVLSRVFNTGRYLCTGAVEDVTSRRWIHLTLEREGCTFLRNVGTCKPCCTHYKSFQKTRIPTIGSDETSADSCTVCWTCWALLLSGCAYEVFCRL